MPNDNAGTIQNSLRPGDFSNIVEAEHSRLRIRWFQPLGGVFVAVGLLLAFINLVAVRFASMGT